MATTKYCPICYSEISETNEADVENFIWSDDPILIYDGYNFIDGEGNPTTDPSAIGFCQIFLNHILELQDNRRIIEENMLSLEDRTEFSPINEEGIFLITAKHIVELRWSTEKILNVTGQTKEQYFNYNSIGEDQRPDEHQMDWTDPLPRTTSDPENYNNNYTFDLINHYLENHFQLKGIHIEDLRHYLTTFFRETWTPLELQTFYDISGTSFQHTQIDFNGDKPNWRAIGQINMSTALNRFAQVRAKVIDVAKKVELYQKCSLTLKDVADTSNVTTSNGIRVPEHSINQIIVSNTILSGNIDLSFVYSNSLSGNPYGWSDCQINVGAVTYYTDDSIATESVGYNIHVGRIVIHLPKANLANLSRNLYNDFYSIHGTYPDADTKVSQFALSLSQSLPAKVFGDFGANLLRTSTCVVDNLQVKNETL